MGGTGGGRIVRTYTNYGAPTGESTRYVLEDGSVWKDAPPCEGPYVTGRERGWRIGDQIKPGRT